jgi:hypothetical protein
MKNIARALSIASLSMVSLASADELIGFDGCYQLYLSSSLYPVICISGSAEEGISGAEVRVVSVGPNSDRVGFCRKTTSSGPAESAQGRNRSVYEFEESSPIRTIAFDGALNAEGREEGSVTITERGKPSKLSYLKLLPEDTRTAMKAFRSERCRQNGIN